MIKELLIIILAPIVCYLFWVYRDKRQAEKLSDRLHNVENNVTQLKNESRLKNER